VDRQARRIGSNRGVRWLCRGCCRSERNGLPDATHERTTGRRGRSHLLPFPPVLAGIARAGQTPNWRGGADPCRGWGRWLGRGAVSDVGRGQLCRSLGAETVINYTETDFVSAVLDATDGRGVDVAFDSVGGDVTTRTFDCMAFNGRHLLVGFASGIEAEDQGIVPRPILFGNFSLCGVCHAYVDDPAALKRARHFNFPSHADGERVHARILELVAGDQVHPVVGEEAEFGELPAALQRMANRETVGRTVVRVGHLTGADIHVPSGT